jgi:hypothetical protein
MKLMLIDNNKNKNLVKKLYLFDIINKNNKNSTSVRFELTRVNPTDFKSVALTTRPRRLIQYKIKNSHMKM